MLGDRLTKVFTGTVLLERTARMIPLGLTVTSEGEVAERCACVARMSHVRLSYVRRDAGVDGLAGMRQHVAMSVAGVPAIRLAVYMNVGGAYSASQTMLCA